MTKQNMKYSLVLKRLILSLNNILRPKKIRNNNTTTQYPRRNIEERAKEQQKKCRVIVPT